MTNINETPSIADRTRRRIFSHVIPFLFILYLFNFINRVNVSYAALQMRTDLNFTDEAIGFGAGIFFVGYFLLQVPGTLLIERWSARKLIAIVAITWGVLSILTGLVNTQTQFYYVRFLLGLAQASFYPGILVYLTHWFHYRDRAKAVALFMCAPPIANMLGSPISGVILGVHWLDLEGWRWVFIIEGVPTIILGVVAYFYVTDWPHQANWLTDNEQQWIINKLEREKQIKNAAESLTLFQALKHRQVILLMAVYFLIVNAYYGFSIWLPTIIKKLSGMPNLTVTVISAIPYIIGLASMIVFAWSSDRSGERRMHTAIPMFIAGLGFVLSLLTKDQIALSITMFCIVAVGVHSYLPSLWSLPTALLSESVAAATVGLINAVGNLGGFIGPYVVGYVSTATGSFAGGMIFLIACTVTAGVLALLLKQPEESLYKSTPTSH